MSDDWHSAECWQTMAIRSDGFCLCGYDVRRLTAERDAALERVKELEAALHEFGRPCEDGWCGKCRLTAKLLLAKGQTT